MRIGSLILDWTSSRQRPRQAASGTFSYHWRLIRIQGETSRWNSFGAWSGFKDKVSCCFEFLVNYSYWNLLWSWSGFRIKRADGTSSGDWYGFQTRYGITSVYMCKLCKCSFLRNRRAFFNYQRNHLLSPEDLIHKELNNFLYFFKYSSSYCPLRLPLSYHILFTQDQ